jgi:hypothetical protein
MVVAQASIGVAHDHHMLQLTNQIGPSGSVTGISFQVQSQQHLTPHASCLTSHTSYLTLHTSHLTPHTSHPSARGRNQRFQTQRRQVARGDRRARHPAACPRQQEDVAASVSFPDANTHCGEPFFHLQLSNAFCPANLIQMNFLTRYQAIEAGWDVNSVLKVSALSGSCLSNLCCHIVLFFISACTPSLSVHPCRH